MRTRLLAFVVLLFSVAARGAPAPAALPEGLYAEITTPRGAIVCELFAAKTPLTVANFVGLAEGTLGPKPRKPYFDGVTFHRVVPDFVVQGGDPTGTGDGGPGYTFPDEVQPGLRHDRAGMLSMANLGPDTNGSQFFLTLRETNRLNYLHTVFGRAIRGADVLAQIQQGDAMTVKILRVGAAAKAFRADEETFAMLQARTKKYADVPAAKPEPAPDAHVHDPHNLLPSDPARFFAQSPSAAEDAEPGAFMRALAAKLGTARRGALVAYFADEDDFRVWIGDESAAAFVGERGTAAEFTASGRMHDVKEAFLEQARAAGDADFARQQKSSPPGKSPAANQRLKLQTDAVLDGLIFKLEPK